MSIPPDTTVASVSAAPGFTNALRGEFALTRRRLAVWVSLGAWAMSIAVFAYLVTYVSTVGAEWYTPEQQDLFVTAMLPGGVAYYILASLPLYAAPQMVILGAVIGASDHVRGTIRTLVSRFPNRDTFMAARLTSLLGIAAGAAVVTLLTSVLSSLAVAAASGRSSAFPPLADLGVALLVIWLVAAAFIALGFAVGTLVRSTVTAVVIAVVWVLGVESLLVGMLAPVVALLGSVQSFLPVAATASLAASLVPAGQATLPAITASTDPGTAVIVLVAWTVVTALVAHVAFRARDLA